MNFDNPPLSSPLCQRQSVMGGVEGEGRRAIFRSTQRQKNNHKKIKDSAVNLFSYCSNALTLPPSSYPSVFFTLVHLFPLSLSFCLPSSIQFKESQQWHKNIYISSIRNSLSLHEYNLQFRYDFLFAALLLFLALFLFLECFLLLLHPLHPCLPHPLFERLLLSGLNMLHAQH